MSEPSFPVALQLRGKLCLVAGRGDELSLRARALLEAGARVEIVAEAADEAVRELGRSGRVELHERPLSDADLRDKWLCVLVGADAERAREVGRVAERERVFFCAVDAPGHNGFSHMALARAGDLVIAIATAGQAPALARRLREELQRLLDESDMATFVERLAELRRVTPSADRKRVLGEAVAGVHFTGELKLQK